MSRIFREFLYGAESHMCRRVALIISSFIQCSVVVGGWSLWISLCVMGHAWILVRISSGSEALFAALSRQRFSAMCVFGMVNGWRGGPWVGGGGVRLGIGCRGVWWVVLLGGGGSCIGMYQKYVAVYLSHT